MLATEGARRATEVASISTQSPPPLFYSCQLTYALPIYSMSYPDKLILIHT